MAQLVERSLATRGPRSESSHWQTLYIVYYQLYWKDEERKQEAGNGPFYLTNHFLSLRVVSSIYNLMLLFQSHRTKLGSSAAGCALYEKKVMGSNLFTAFLRDGIFARKRKWTKKRPGWRWIQQAVIGTCHRDISYECLHSSTTPAAFH